MLNSTIERIELIEDLLNRGWSKRELLRELGIQSDSALKFLRYHGRHDLADRIIAKKN